MSCHLKEWLILVGIWRYTDPICAGTRPLVWSSGCWILDLGSGLSICLAWIGLKSCVWENEVCRWAKLFHIQLCLIVQKCTDKSLCQWDSPGKRRGSIPLPLTSSQCSQVQSCGQPSSFSCSWGMEHWGMMQNYPVAQKRSLVNSLQSSQTVRDNFLTQKLLYLPRCTSVWDLFWWGMETNHSVEWELLVAEDPKGVWWYRQEAVPMYLMEKFFKWKMLKVKNMLSRKFERIKCERSLEPSHWKTTMQQ